MTEDEKVIVQRYLQEQIDWREHEAKRIECGDDFAHSNGGMRIVSEHIAAANVLRQMLGGII